MAFEPHPRALLDIEDRPVTTVPRGSGRLVSHALGQIPERRTVELRKPRNAAGHLVRVHSAPEYSLHVGCLTRNDGGARKIPDICCRRRIHGVLGPAPWKQVGDIEGCPAEHTWQQVASVL